MEERKNKKKKAKETLTIYEICHSIWFDVSDNLGFSLLTVTKFQLEYLKNVFRFIKS